MYLVNVNVFNHPECVIVYAVEVMIVSVKQIKNDIKITVHMDNNVGNRYEKKQI